MGAEDLGLYELGGLEELPRRSVERYTLEDVRADWWCLAHPIRAFRLLPRNTKGRVAWRAAAAAGWYYAASPGRWVARRAWGTAVCGALTGLALAPAALVTGTSMPERMVTITIACGAFVYVAACLLARRIGLWTANRYLESDVPKR